MSPNRRYFAVLAAVATLAITGCVSTPAPRTIADTAAATPELSTLSRLIQDAGLADTLRGPGPFTVFAPTNEAFAKVPTATMAQLTADRERLRAVLTYHVLAGRTASSEVKTGPAKTVQGSNVGLSRAGTFVTVEDAVVTRADLAATNGVVHMIDTVLIPPAPRR